MPGLNPAADIGHTLASLVGGQAQQFLSISNDHFQIGHQFVLVDCCDIVHQNLRV